MNVIYYVQIMSEWYIYELNAHKHHHKVIIMSGKLSVKCYYDFIFIISNKAETTVCQLAVIKVLVDCLLNIC